MTPTVIPQKKKKRKRKNHVIKYNMTEKQNIYINIYIRPSSTHSNYIYQTKNVYRINQKKKEK